MTAARRRQQPRRVVIVGGSLAGAFSAAAVWAHGRSVTVVEADTLPVDPQPRKGVPQGRQPHVFLYRGLLAVEELLPGLRSELMEAGAVPLDTGNLAWLGEFGWAPSGRREFPIYSASRPLFEHLVMRRVRALPGVEIRDGVRVEGVRPGPAGGPAWQVELGDGAVLDADLVIDASGRSSRLPTWLSRAGVSAARVSTVDARLGYASRSYAIDPASVATSGVVFLQTPQTQMGGLALPVEGDRWLVAGVGSGHHRPPRDVAGFEAFLSRLPDGALAELVRTGVPQDEVAVHRQTANQHNHYADVSNWPAGLLVIGDALCAFNPVYGQGVTVAACEALELRKALRRGLRHGDERRLLRAFDKVAALPWAIATGEDLRYPATTGTVSRRQALLNRWTRELGRLSTHGDVLAHGSVARVFHLMGSPWLLFRPGLVAAALRARVRGYGPATTRPTIVRPAAPQATSPEQARTIRLDADQAVRDRA